MTLALDNHASEQKVKDDQKVEKRKSLSTLLYMITSGPGNNMRPVREPGVTCKTRQKRAQGESTDAGRESPGRVDQQQKRRTFAVSLTLVCKSILFILIIYPTLFCPVPLPSHRG